MGTQESTPQGSRRPLGPLTPRQEELIRIIQALPAHARTTLTVVCRGTEPWELQKLVEDERIGEIRPRP
jgi:hypothetical protein